MRLLEHSVRVTVKETLQKSLFVPLKMCEKHARSSVRQIEYGINFTDYFDHVLDNIFWTKHLVLEVVLFGIDVDKIGTFDKAVG